MNYRLNEKGIRYASLMTVIGVLDTHTLLHLNTTEWAFDTNFYRDEAAFYISQDIGVNISEDMIEKVEE